MCIRDSKNAVPDFLREKGVEEIEYAVFTHPHADHIGAAAEVVRGFRVKNVYMPDVAHTSKTYLDLLDALEADELIAGTLGDHVLKNYVAGKRKEWDAFRTAVTDWEIGKYVILY